MTAYEPGPGGAPPREEKPLTSLLADLANETTSLVRKEVELAKAELSEKATEAGKGVASLAIGGAVAFCGLLVLLAALVLVLDTFLPSWAAALVVGVVVLGIGFVMIQSGRKKLSATSLQPTRTIETVKDDARWAKTQISQ